MGSVWEMLMKIIHKVLLVVIHKSSSSYSAFKNLGQYQKIMIDRSIL